MPPSPLKNGRDVTEPAKIRIRRISYEKSVGCGCGFVARSKFVSASYYSYCDSTSNSKLNDRLKQLFVSYENYCTVEPKQKFLIRYNRV